MKSPPFRQCSTGRGGWQDKRKEGGENVAKGKEVKIRVESYVHVGNQLVNTRDLTEEQKVKLAGWIKLNWCQELYRGKAVFSLTEHETLRME
jgi:hypothetical protein